jgi:hypothetical protein
LILEYQNTIYFIFNEEKANVYKIENKMMMSERVIKD